jgi:hypothetical protein
MIDLSEFASRLRRCADGQSIEDFEEWFDSASWNVHQENNEVLTDFVFRVESLLSAYAEGRLSGESVREQLKGLAIVLRPFPWIQSAENRNPEASYLPIPSGPEPAFNLASAK